MSEASLKKDRFWFLIKDEVAKKHSARLEPLRRGGYNAGFELHEFLDKPSGKAERIE